MPIQAGQFLQSHSFAADDYFYEAIVYLVQHDLQGALGFVVNRSFPRFLNELQEFAQLPPFPLAEGGPVDVSHLYFIHRRPDMIEDGVMISNSICFGGNFEQVITSIENGSITDKDIRIFAGYCGWDAGDLEKEMEEKGWSTVHIELFS